MSFTVTLILLMIFALAMSACSSNTDGTKTGNTAGEGNKQTNSGTNNTSEKQNDEPAEPEKHDPVTLTIINNWTGEEPGVKSMIEDFQKHYPWITIKIETVLEGPAAKVAKAVALQAAGTPADIIGADELTSGQELFEDLGPWLDKDADLKSVNFPVSFLNAYKVGGKQLALPGANAAPFLFFVNKDLLAKHGLEMPSPDWTYDDLLNMAKQATDPAAGEWGLAPSIGISRYLPSALAIANGHAANHTFLNEDMSKSVASTPEVLADVQWVQELQTKHHVIPDRAKATEQSLSDAFMQGKALFDSNGVWYTGNLRDQAQFDWDVLPYPKGSVSQPTTLFNAPFTMLSASKHKEEAWLYYKYGLSKEGIKFAIDDGQTPWGLDQEQQDYLLSNKAWEGKNTDTIKQLYTGETCCANVGANIKDFGDYYNTIYGGLDQILLDSAKVSDIFLPAADKFNSSR
ncbi:sugar ABC transporter substrate-binding protein [Paenibacillus nasutitermitis]|uniref:Sugar ABC transporter substrate-binding protein n=2 Tax=Paenibacillus nasutitermitis TaxID=1652958 RepID=A0A916YQY6_9BACL|nr:sugar ABC transporter substrate-binding protein [Paenibacillus nasutitermitis]